MRPIHELKIDIFKELWDAFEIRKRGLRYLSTGRDRRGDYTIASDTFRPWVIDMWLVVELEKPTQLRRYGTYQLLQPGLTTSSLFLR